jgi:hypothetical protein
MPKTPQAELAFNQRRDHAIRRAQERFALQLDRNEYAYLNRLIQKQKSKRQRLADLRERRAAYKLHYRGNELIAVYSHHHHQILTFLTFDQFLTIQR